MVSFSTGRDGLILYRQWLSRQLKTICDMTEIRHDRLYFCAPKSWRVANLIICRTEPKSSCNDKTKTKMYRRNRLVMKSMESVLGPEKSLWWARSMKEGLSREWSQTLGIYHIAYQLHGRFADKPLTDSRFADSTIHWPVNSLTRRCQRTDISESSCQQDDQSANRTVSENTCQQTGCQRNGCQWIVRSPHITPITGCYRLWVKCRTAVCGMWNVKCGMECAVRWWLAMTSPHAMHRLRGGKMHTEHVESCLLHSACNF